MNFDQYVYKILTKQHIEEYGKEFEFKLVRLPKQGASGEEIRRNLMKRFKRYGWQLATLSHLAIWWQRYQCCGWYEPGGVVVGLGSFNGWQPDNPPYFCLADEGLGISRHADDYPDIWDDAGKEFRYYFLLVRPKIKT